MKMINMMWLALVMLLTTTLGAQTVYRLAPTHELKVEGTSTLHDWEMITKAATAQATIGLEGNTITSLAGLTAEFAVNSLKSGNTRMDRTAYSSIDATKHPQVKFTLTRVRSITNSQVVAEGTLTMGGQTRPVTLRTNYRVNGNSIVFSAKEKVSFSQFDLKPPTALMGTVKTGDELDISFEVNFVRTVAR